MITHQEETLEQCMDAILPLVVDHWDETSFLEETLVLQPYYSKYLQLQANDELKIYTLRDAGNLIGYAIFIIDSPLHFEGNTIAKNDLLYIDPKYRGKGLAPKLLEYVHTELTKHADAVMISVTEKVPFDSLLMAEGYTQRERTYVKSLRG